ncbi:beta-propeller fold lactonase family protein [Ferrovibrio terrae]|uniref:lactonase family protein n=1 Tax=Ferrovibrio terrae TaxID=2594003 RepID=UPI0031377A6D
MKTYRTGLLAVAFACGLLASAAQADTYVYVGNADSNDIHVLKLNKATGDLAPVQVAPFPGIEKAGPSTPLAVSPDRKFLYAGVRAAPFTAVGFAIDAKTGRLQHTANGPLADSMAYIATDRSGKYLLSASYGGHKITVNPITPAGTVQAPSQVITTGQNAHAILPSPDNRYVFATNLGSDVVLTFKFDSATGMLTQSSPPNTVAPAKSGPRHLVFHPNGKFAYLLTELSADIIAYRYDAKAGTLKDLQTVSIMPAGGAKPWAADLQITRDGRFIYGSERTTSTLTGFKVDATTGKLTRIGEVPTQKQPRGFGIDPSSTYLFAVGEQSHALTAYRINATTGALTPMKDYPVGKKPNWVEVIDFK